MNAVRILVLSTRYPEAHAKGDALRVRSWIVALAERHEVRVVTCAPAPAPERRLPHEVDVVCIPAGRVARACSALAAGTRGAPLQVGWMMPRRAWRTAAAAMDDADVVLVCTSRSLRGPATRPLVLDHVDALSLNMQRRAHGDEPLPVRLFARLEASRFKAWERRCARWSAAAIATAQEDADALPADPPVQVIPTGLDRADPAWAAARERPIDVVLSGNMRYPPNRRAALLLDREIAPALRARIDGVRIVVAGRGADTLGLRDVEVMSDVPDMLAVLGTAKVAIAPLELGTGSPSKVLEAAACGAAVVASPWTLAPYAMPGRAATDAQGYCDAVCELLAHPDRRAQLVAQSQDAVQRHLVPVLAARVERLLVAAAEGQRARLIPPS